VEVNPAEYFDYEIVAFGAATTPRFPIKVVEENEEYILRTTSYGGLRRDHKDIQLPRKSLITLARHKQTGKKSNSASPLTEIG